jgi:hypothetical protein
MLFTGVADPGCLSRILIFTHPASQILNPKTATKERGEKKFVVIGTFFVATKFTKLKIILFLKCCRKKFWVSFQRIIELFTQKFVTTVSKIGGWDPRSGIRKKTYSGSATLLFTSQNILDITLGNEECLKLLVGVCNTKKRGDLSLSLLFSLDNLSVSHQDRVVINAPPPVTGSLHPVFRICLRIPNQGP